MEEKKFKEAFDNFKKDKRLFKVLEKNISKAKNLLQDKEKIDGFLIDLEVKLSKIPKAGKYFADVPIFILLVKSYLEKEYTKIPLGLILAILASLMYVLSPMDLIPDFVPILGYADDAAMIAIVYKLVHDDLQEYKDWRQDKRE